MRYSSPVTFRNTILEEYVPKRKIDPEDVCLHVTEKMPFLIPDLVSLNIPGDHPCESQAEPEPKRETPDAEVTITDGEFFKLVPAAGQQCGKKNNDEKGETQP